MSQQDRSRDACDKSKCRDSAELAFPFLAQQGNLVENWYPLGFSSELKPNQPMRQIVLGVPVLVWRNSSRQLCSFVDICPHRQAQLSQGTVNHEGVTCPYHGWRFDDDGKCAHVPVSPPSKTPSDSNSLTPIPTCEHGGMIWAWMSRNPPRNPPTVLDSFDHEGGWRLTRARRTFAYDLDDVIENFMDFAHTPVVHPGLIRGISEPRERGVTIETQESSVRAVHDPVDERVGFLSGLVIPRGKLVQHADTFSMPGNVKVEYWFGEDAPSFVAFLGLTPISPKETLILLTLGTRFGKLNPLIGLALPRLIRKVLDQDDKILAQQRANLDLNPKRGRSSLQSDAVDATVRALRAHFRDGSQTRPPLGTKRIRVLL